MWRALEWNDVAQGLMKPLVVRVSDLTNRLLSTDLRTSGGTQGVGRATTQAVVAAVSCMVFVLTFFITQIFVSQAGFVMAD